MGDRIMICRTCAVGNGRFAEALRDRTGACVDLVDCLNACGQPTAMALSGPGKDSYLFAGIDPSRDMADAVALTRLYAGACPGIADARATGRLRHCLIGRIPAPLTDPPAP